MFTRILAILLLVPFPQQLETRQPKLRSVNSIILATQRPQDKDCAQALKNAQATASQLEGRLGDCTRSLKACERERDTFRADRARFEQQYNSCQSTLNLKERANRELEGTNGRLLKVSEDLQRKLEESGKGAAETTQQLEALRAEIRKEPAKLLASDDLTKKDAGQAASMLRSFEEGGRVHEIRELLIGTLEIVSVHNETTVPGELELKVTFRPHRILTDSGGEGSVSWYLELEIRPDKIRTFEYDARSNGALKRKVGDKPEEEWIWKIRPMASFQLDKPHVFGFASFERGTETSERVEIENREVEITEKYVPGLIASIWGFIKNNFTFILGAFTAMLAVATGYFGLKKQQLDVKLSQMKLELEELSGKKSNGGPKDPDEQPETS